MDDQVDAFDVETAGCDVGGDEDGAGVGGGRGEALDGAETGLLGHGGVQGYGGELEGLEELG